MYEIISNLNEDVLGEIFKYSDLATIKSLSIIPEFKNIYGKSLLDLEFQKSLIINDPFCIKQRKQIDKLLFTYNYIKGTCNDPGRSMQNNLKFNLENAFFIYQKYIVKYCNLKINVDVSLSSFNIKTKHYNYILYDGIIHII